MVNVAIVRVVFRRMQPLSIDDPVAGPPTPPPLGFSQSIQVAWSFSFLFFFFFFLFLSVFPLPSCSYIPPFSVYIFLSLRDFSLFFSYIHLPFVDPPSCRTPDFPSLSFYLSLSLSLSVTLSLNLALSLFLSLSFSCSHPIVCLSRSLDSVSAGVRGTPQYPRRIPLTSKDTVNVARRRADVRSKYFTS